MPDEVDDCWGRDRLRLSGSDDWASEQLIPVIEAAAASERLRRLFPFQSLNRMCFSREPGPPADDLPCIVAQRDGRYLVQATWRPTDQPEVLVEPMTLEQRSGP